MVPEIVALIEDLIERGHAYVAEGDVYFRVRSLPEYGALSHRDVDQMDQGEGVEGAGARRTRSTSRCGRRASRWRTRRGTRRGAAGGRLAHRVLGDGREELGAPFEIHGGGNDLIFPHHENEAAQTLAGRGKPLAQIWMHNGMLRWARRRWRSRSATSRSLADVLDESAATR